MAGPLLAWIQKLAFQHFWFYTWRLKSIHYSYNIHTCFPIIVSNVLWLLQTLFDSELQVEQCWIYLGEETGVGPRSSGATVQ